MGTLAGYVKAGITTIADMNAKEFWNGANGLIIPSDKKIEQTVTKRIVVENKNIDVLISTEIANGITNTKCNYIYPFIEHASFSWNSCIWNDQYLTSSDPISEIPMVCEQRIENQESSNTYVSYKSGFGVIKDGGVVSDYKTCENSILTEQHSSIVNQNAVTFMKFNKETTELKSIGSYSNNGFRIKNSTTDGYLNLSVPNEFTSDTNFFTESKINPNLYNSSSGGLPSWITTDDSTQKMTIGTNNKAGDFEVKGKMKFENTNITLQENSIVKAKDVQIAPNLKFMSYIDVNNSGIDEKNDVEYELNEENNTCTLIYANNKNMEKYLELNENSIVRRVSDNKLFTIIEIGENAFIDHPNFVVDSIPDEITIIGLNSFALCKNMPLKKLPSNLIEIKEGGFLECIKIDLSLFPENLRIIGENGLAGCTLLSTIDCTKVTNLTIGSNAFKNCKKCILKMNQALATSLGSRIVNGKIDDATVQIVDQYQLVNNTDEFNVTYTINDSNGTATIATKELPNGYIKPSTILDKKTDRLYKVVYIEDQK